MVKHEGNKQHLIDESLGWINLHEHKVSKECNIDYIIENDISSASLYSDNLNIAKKKEKELIDNWRKLIIARKDRIDCEYFWLYYKTSKSIN